MSSATRDTALLTITALKIGPFNLKPSWSQTNINSSDLGPLLVSLGLHMCCVCHQILLNVGRLTRADRCSLFLARGPRDNRHLEAKLFDVGANTGKEGSQDDL